MKTHINQRGNGACPICKKEKHCSIREKMLKAIHAAENHGEIEMELVIYKCSRFEEKL